MGRTADRSKKDKIVNIGEENENFQTTLGPNLKERLWREPL